MPTIVPEIIPAPAPAAAPIQESRPACVPRQVEDVTPFRAPSRAPRRVASMPLPATSAQVPVRPEAVRADCSHSFSREDSTNCASPVARAGALAQPAPSSIAPRAAASRLCRHTASMHVTSEVGGGHHHRFSWLPQGVLSCPSPCPRLSSRQRSRRQAVDLGPGSRSVGGRIVEGLSMRVSSFVSTPLSRRRFVQGAAAAGLFSPGSLLASPAAWAQRPAGNPSRLTFVVWQYGKIYEQIAKQFEDDWGVKLNQIIEPNVEPQVAKLTTMFAAGDEVDVSLSPIQYLASYIQQGIAQPVDGLPGLEQYVKDFTPFARATAQRDGKTWGLPYFSTAWIFIYNDELLAKAGFKGKPFKSYPELIEQARKAKKDGVAKYPILWIAGAGFEQLPGTWFNLTWNRGGVIFDKQLNPQLCEPALHSRVQGVQRWPARLPRHAAPLLHQPHQRPGAVAHCGQGTCTGAARRRQDHRLHHAVLHHR